MTPWYSADDRLAALLEGKRIGHDGLYPIGQDLSAELTLLRAQLSEAEQERFRSLGWLCAASMDEAVRAVKPGMTEFEIAALLAGATESRGAQAVVDLVGTAERIFTYRHAIPTDKKLDCYAMLVLCGRQAGLICSITRLVHFGPLPEEVERKMQAVAAVDAAMIAATRPGSTLKYVFAVGQKAYAAQGYPNEWQLHHQGGLAGYEPREITATPTTRQAIEQGQAFAWNPSIKGAKSEDTILVGEQTNEIITEIDGWPMLTIEAGPVVYKRPAILVKD